MVTSQILRSVALTKSKNLDILRMKHNFLFKQKNSLITHQKLLFGEKKFAAEATFNHRSI